MVYPLCNQHYLHLPNKHYFYANKNGSLKYLKIAVPLVFVLAFVWFVYAEFIRPVEITPLTESWEKVVPHQEIPKGLVSLSAKDCGVCHQAHYNEWKRSTHAMAWVDLQFQAELRKESSPFMCINCHTPLQNQQPFIIEGMEEGDIYRPVKKVNPLFDEALQQEGINCASCHVRDGHIIGKIGSDLAPHPVKVDPIHLSEQLCISCHNATAVLTPTLACSFETGDEWKAGPYFGKENCLSCHMQERIRPLVYGMPERTSHFHGFPGSGIPKFDTLTAESLDGMEIFTSKVENTFRKGEKIPFWVTVVNASAGHRLPTGDPERFYLIKMKFFDDQGTLVHQTKNRIGEHWEWHPEAKKISDNNLNPLESRKYSTAFIPEKMGQYTVKVEVTKHRMDEKTAAFNKLGKNYPLFIYVFEKEFNMTVTE